MSEGRNLLEPTQGAFTELMSDPEAVEVREQHRSLSVAYAMFCHVLSCFVLSSIANGCQCL